LSEPKNAFLTQIFFDLEFHFEQGDEDPCRKRSLRALRLKAEL